MPKVRFETDANICRITLDDAPLHILDIELLGDLLAALRQVPEDRSLLVITASGEKAFSAGASVPDHRAETVAEMLGRFHDCFRLLHRTGLVTVALVNGAALGGGCELALACDFVLASDKARFGQPEINLGVFPPVAAFQLSRQLAPRLGMELLLTGDAISAETARGFGLVNAVFPQAEFSRGSDEWLQRLLRQSPSSLRLAKRAFRLASSDDFEEKLAEVEQLYLEELMNTEDAAEGLNAFMEKRRPVWKGR
ncbi:MAG: enoyl-CoA hydratase-related protein [Acidobacteriota bacterium]